MPTQREERAETQILATEAFNFIQEQYEEFIQKVVTFNADRVHVNSVNSKSDPAHNVFFEAFKSFCMKICDLLYIPTKDWAIAFMQDDLESTTVKLCRGIYYCHFNNLSNPSGHDIGNYTDFIYRASLWMQEKNRDPWSYRYDACDISPTPQQINVMENGMQKFAAERRFLDNSLNELATDFIAPVHYELDELDEILNSLGNPTPDSPNELSAIYLKIFQTFMTHLSRRPDSFPGAKNPALVATALTRAIIPSNKDIRVDAVPFSNNRWTAAANHPTLAETAERLYSTHFYFEFIFRDRASDYKGVEDVCPFTRLAVYRSSMFLWKMWRGEIVAQTYDFNQENPDHNWFPNLKERAEIDRGMDNAARSNFEKYNIIPGRVLEVFGTPDAPSSSSGNSADSVQPGITDDLPPPAGNPQAPLIDWAGLDVTQYVVPQDVRTETQELYNTGGRKPAGTHLFDKIFLRVEKENCSLNGNRGYRKFNEAKVNAFFDTMQQIVGETGEDWIQTKNLLCKEVFTEYCTHKYRGPKVKKNFPPK